MPISMIRLPTRSVRQARTCTPASTIQSHCCCPMPQCGLGEETRFEEVSSRILKSTNPLTYSPQICPVIRFQLLDRRYLRFPPTLLMAMLLQYKRLTPPALARLYWFGLVHRHTRLIKSSDLLECHSLPAQAPLMSQLRQMAT